VETRGAVSWAEAKGADGCIAAESDADERVGRDSWNDIEKIGLSALIVNNYVIPRSGDAS
jgi:hypothetical protein